MNSPANTPPEVQLFFLMPRQVLWWVWLLTAALIVVGLSGYAAGYLAAIAITFVQLLVFGIREGSALAFAVQLRIAFAALLCVCYLPYMRWLYWWPMLGTFAMLIFGYCLLARMLYLLPWNRDELMSFDMLSRTFFSRPKLPSDKSDQTSGCAGGVCSIKAQVKMRSAIPAESAINA